MTTDQLIRLLSALAWPAVAVILALAAVHVAGTWADVAESAIITADRRARKTVEEACATIVALHVDRGAVARSPDPVTRMSERVLELLVQTNGGFPAARGDKVGRQLVREVREMYQELARATEGPEPGSRGGAAQGGADDLTLDSPGDGADDLDDATADEVFAQFHPDDDREELGLE